MCVFAQRLKELRGKLNLTQRQFGEQCQTTGAAISAYEKGQKLPSLTVATRIAQNFHVSLDWLFGLDETAAQEKIPQTAGDFAEMVLNLIDEQVPIFMKTMDFDLGEAAALGFVDEYSGEDYLVCDMESGEDELPVRMVVLQLRNTALASFFDGWLNMNRLKQDRTIDEKLFSLWLDDQLGNLKKAPLI